LSPGLSALPPTNFFDVGVSSDGDGYRNLQHPFFTLKLDQGHTALLKGYNKSKLMLGVRPENIQITDQAHSIFSEEALVVEPQGSHQVVALDLEGTIVKIVAPAHPKVSPGETLHLNFQQERIHLFDAETQKRIR
jgi:multiple sugar transport system ATP-binding protein